jgi:hypothetical protein
MQFGDRNLDHAFDPLKVVDVKTMAIVAENLKKSKNKKKRAIGVFLDRVNRLRTAEMDKPAPGEEPSANRTATTHTDTLKSSGLRDLRE